ncbi:MAG: sensor histidine kinase [Actinomycetota bacterium]|nr:sensor histidine kinase [Actinomycetota bacterium]MDD5665846.1 sensor histidine kinase [Actinomycetota bacterium]
MDTESMRRYLIPCPVPELADFIDRNSAALFANILARVEGSLSPEMLPRLRGGGQLQAFIEALSRALRSGDVEPFLAYQAQQVERFAREGVSLGEVESLGNCIREAVMETLMKTASTPDQMLSYTMSSNILEKFVDATLTLTARHYILAREEELLQKEAQLERLAHQVLMAQEEERRRIRQDIHDEFIQLLFGLRYQLDILQSKLGERAKAEVEIAEIKGRIDRGLTELRHILRNLRPAVLDDLGLMPALKLLARQLQETAGLEVMLLAEEEDARLSPEAESCLYRVAQEALANIVKHADASRVDVSLCVDEEGVRLCIEDDGEGLEKEAGAGQSVPRGSVGLGLYGMQERVRGIGGDFYVESKPGAGTRITVVLPLPGGRLRCHEGRG